MVDDQQPELASIPSISILRLAFDEDTFDGGVEEGGGGRGQSVMSFLWTMVASKAAKD